MNVSSASSKSSASSGNFQGPRGNVGAPVAKPGNFSVVEMLAEELHKQYRAAFKALHRPSGTRYLNEHDHGWLACHKRTYFLRRAALLIKRASVINPETLGDAEVALAATVFLRRLRVGGNIRLRASVLLDDRSVDCGKCGNTHGDACSCL